MQVNLLTIVVATVFCLLMVMLFTRRRHIDCLDLITSPDGRVSRTAIGQTLGIFVAVWAPVYTTIDDKLDATVLTVCLTYLGLVEGYAKWLRWKADQVKKEGG